MAELSFGPDLGPIKVVGLAAKHHCEAFVDQRRVGHVYQGNGYYEYRGEAVGADELTYLCRIDKRDLVNNLLWSLKADLKKPQAPEDGQASVQ